MNNGKGDKLNFSIPAHSANSVTKPRRVLLILPDEEFAPEGGEYMSVKGAEGELRTGLESDPNAASGPNADSGEEFVSHPYQDLLVIFTKLQQNLHEIELCLAKAQGVSSRIESLSEELKSHPLYHSVSGATSHELSNEVSNEPSHESHNTVYNDQLAACDLYDFRASVNDMEANKNHTQKQLREVQSFCAEVYGEPDTRGLTESYGDDMILGGAAYTDAP